MASEAVPPLVKRPSAPMRERILEAAETVLRRKGLPGMTTREIAHVAGCAEGSLYNHFASKEALVLAVMAERLPGFIRLVRSLPERAGTDDVRERLVEIARTALDFYAETLPMMSAALTTPALRERLRAQGMGPHRANEGIVAWLERERALGRIDAAASAEATAALLLGACQQRAVLDRFRGIDRDPAEDQAIAEELADTLLAGIRPRGGGPGGDP